MKTFSIYRHPTQGIEAVKIGFSWPAFFFYIPWMLVKKLWGLAGTWFAANFVLVLVEQAITRANIEQAIAQADGGGAQAFAYLILIVGKFTLWFVPAFKGNNWREQDLFKRGYEQLVIIQAETADAAIAKANQTNYSSQPITSSGS